MLMHPKVWTAAAGIHMIHYQKTIPLYLSEEPKYINSYMSVNLNPRGNSGTKNTECLIFALSSLVV